MTDGRTTSAVDRLSAAVRGRIEDLRWWYALRVGGAPDCAVCGDNAAWIAEARNEPRCFKHIPNDGTDAIRDVRPEDCLTDWDETADT